MNVTLSPYPDRARRAGPKGLFAENARAVTGRQCTHSKLIHELNTPIIVYTPRHGLDKIQE